MDNRFYLQALGITGLFILVMVLFWAVSGGPASEAAVQSANSTRTAIAMTGSYLLQPRTRTPLAVTMTDTPLPQPVLPSSTATALPLPSVTNTSLLPQLNTPISSPVPSLTPLSTQTTVAPTVVLLPTQTAIAPTSTSFPTQTALVQIPVSPGHASTKAPRRVPQSGTPVIVQPSAAPAAGLQDPVEFARWYFTRVWTERDYQNLWDNYLTISFKANVGSGLFQDYVWWWSSVQQVDINSVVVLENNGTDAVVRVDLTFHMTDGRVIENQVYTYDFLYDPSRATWMFDASG